MASSDQPAEDWEETALDKLSLGNGVQRTPVSQRSQSLASSTNEARPITGEEEAASRSSNQTCSSSSPPQPFIDPAVRDALINPKYRLQVLRFEADVETFVRQGGDTDLTFSADLTGYQRLLCHRVAQYYGLDTSTIDEGEDQGKILARRTLSTTLPVVRLADVKLNDSRDQQRRVDTPPRVLMKHNRQAQDRARAAAAANGQGSGQANSRTVQEREQDYSKARARIFGMQPGPEGAMPIQDTRHADDGTRNMNGARAPAMGVHAAGRGRGMGGRGDQGKKAVFRNREQDLQDPDYRRGYSFGPRFDPGFGDMSGAQQGMYIRPTYNSEFPELAGGMANRSMQGPFSQGPAPHSPAGPPGLMAAGPMHDSSFMHPVMGAGGPFVPIPMQGVPYAMMGPGGTPMHALPPGLGMHPMQSMPGMFPTPPMAFPAMPMATPYGFVSPGQEGIPMHLGATPAMYGGYPPHQLQFQLPPMSVEQQMHQQQQSQVAASQNARVRPSNNLGRRNSNSQQSFRSPAATRPASATPVAQAQAAATQQQEVTAAGDAKDAEPTSQPEVPAMPTDNSQ